MLEVYFEKRDLGYGLRDEKPHVCQERWASEDYETDQNEEDEIGTWYSVTMHIIGEHEKEVREFQTTIANRDSDTWDMLNELQCSYHPDSEPVTVSKYFQIVHKYQHGKKIPEERVASTIYWEVYSPEI